MKKYEEGDVIKANDADVCPMCGSYEVEQDDRGYEYGCFYAEMYCCDCHGNYLMWFKPHQAVVQAPGYDE